MSNTERREAADVPENILFATKFEIAEKQSRYVIAAGVPRDVGRNKSDGNGESLLRGRHY
jgi:hypothetical protein